MWIVAIMSTYSVSGRKEQKIAGGKDYFDILETVMHAFSQAGNYLV